MTWDLERPIREKTAIGQLQILIESCRKNSKSTSLLKDVERAEAFIRNLSRPVANPKRVKRGINFIQARDE